MVWSCFGFGHGKEVHDDVKVVLKQEIKKKQLNMDGRWLQNVVDVVALCERKQIEEYFAYANIKRSTCLDFFIWWNLKMWIGMLHGIVKILLEHVPYIL